MNVTAALDYANSSNGSNGTVDLECPDYDSSDLALLEVFSFWIEGILQTAVAVFGIAGNTVASVIVCRREMRNSFNLLLVSLACFDSTYLFGSILESFRKNFGLATSAHIVLFPHLLYPFNQMAISGSIFMTVAIAWERYIAVHYPLDYNQAMNDTNAVRKRVTKYVVPVILLSVAFNVVKFFEATITWKAINATSTVPNGTTASGSMSVASMSYEPQLEVAAIRTHPVYSAYNNWSRLIVLGIVPFALLVFFNTKIYNDIVERRRRRLTGIRSNQHRASADSAMVDFSTTFVTNSIKARVRRMSEAFGMSDGPLIPMPPLPPPPPPPRTSRQQLKRVSGPGTAAASTANSSSMDETSFSASGLPPPPPPPQPRFVFEDVDKKGSCNNLSNASSTGASKSIIIRTNSNSNSNSRKGSAGSSLPSRSRISSMEGLKEEEDEINLDGDFDDDDDDEGPPQEISRHPRGSVPALTASASALLLTTDPGLNRQHRRQMQTVNERRRRFEDNLAGVFMGFVMVFLICHLPRLLLNIHELVTIREAMLCTEKGRQGFSVWSLVLISVSHLLLVFNSSINILIYCFLSSRFRKECKMLVKRMSAKRPNRGTNGAATGAAFESPMANAHGPT